MNQKDLNRRFRLKLCKKKDSKTKSDCGLNVNEIASSVWNLQNYYNLIGSLKLFDFFVVQLQVIRLK